METKPGYSQRIGFGVFEVDRRAGELRRQGLKVKLSGQPFEVLVMLLERPGEVISREELQKQLWSESTFVDFEHGLNKTINRIREAIDDDADNPRFIETLPRRGYRFIAPVRGSVRGGWCASPARAAEQKGWPALHDRSGSRAGAGPGGCDLALGLKPLIQITDPADEGRSFHELSRSRMGRLFLPGR